MSLTNERTLGFAITDIGFLHYLDGASRKATDAELVMWEWIMWAKEELAKRTAVGPLDNSPSCCGGTDTPTGHVHTQICQAEPDDDQP